MKFYAMQSEIDPSGVQPFFPVWFNKKKLLKALNALGLSTDWRYFKKNVWDTDITGLIARYFDEQGWNYKVSKGWDKENIA